LKIDQSRAHLRPFRDSHLKLKVDFTIAIVDSTFFAIPDEVDFLSTLVGDDALKEFRQTVGSGDQPAGATNFAGNKETDPSQLLSRRPPQFYNTEDGQDQKNVNPSFPGIFC
jgi:hypothetical protein